MSTTEQPDPAEVQRLLDEIADLSARLDAASAALVTERFKGVPRLTRGTVVLVPRRLFGKVHWHPARIEAVHLDYSSGKFRDGTPWENRIVSYSVYLRQHDGTYGGLSASFYDSEVQPAPSLNTAPAREGQDGSTA